MTATQVPGIKLTDYSDEMSNCYLVYAEDVIKNRALPDIRDGLKPVHRHILWSMWEMGCRHNSPYRKSARIVGDTMGKFHPHGDTAIYDALVRMSQPFSMNIPLVDGQGNFGNIDGDNPAAQRYTEARMARFAEDVLFADIGDDTVDFIQNYDGQEKEPVVLPARIPTILMTSPQGIAVGMATNIPSFNLNEVCNAIITAVKDSTINNETLAKIIPAPDMPIGGLIRADNIGVSYAAGRGKVNYRAIADFEHEGKFKAIIIRSVPTAKKAELIKDIATLVRDGKVEGISEVRDESTKDGIRICVELQRKASHQAVLNSLYKQTTLECNFSMNMVAIRNKKPQSVSMLNIIQDFIEFRREIIKRRTTSKKKKADERLEVVDGLLKVAVDGKKAMEIIQKSENPIKKLKTSFCLTERQADYVAHMQLIRFSKQDNKKLKDEAKELKAFINDSDNILSSKSRIDDIIIKETNEISDRFGMTRKCHLVSNFDSISIKDTIKEEEVVLIFMSDGTVKSTPFEDYRMMKRRGVGTIGTKVPDGVYPTFVSHVNTHDDVMLITNHGNRYRMNAYNVPAMNRMRRPKKISEYVSLFKDNEKVVSVTKSKLGDDECLVILGTNGMLKKMKASVVNKAMDKTTMIYGIDRGGDVVKAITAKNDDDIIVCTATGLALRKSLGIIREVGSRASAGISYIKLADGDKVLGLSVVNKDGYLLTITKDGYGKRTNMNEFAVKSAGKKGVCCCKFQEKDELVFASSVLYSDDESSLFLMSSNNKALRIPFSAISEMGRMARGVKAMKVNGEESVTAVSIE